MGEYECRTLYDSRERLLQEKHAAFNYTGHKTNDVLK